MASNDTIYLNTLLASLLVQNCLEQLSGTPYFKQSLRNSARTFERELDRVIREDIPLVWGEDDDALYTVMDYQRSAIEELSKMAPEEGAVIAAMIQQYRDNPRKVLAFLEMDFEQTKKQEA